MKALFINSVCGIRSTGRICIDLAQELEQQGYEVKIAYGRENIPEKYKKYGVCIGNEFNAKCNALSCRFFDNDGFAAKRQTREFLNWADQFNPDILWLHNLHGYYINVEMLFNWIKSRPNMQVKWTLHDCWSFTGHCSHFDFINCSKWISGCHDCQLKRKYPKSFLFDSSSTNFTKKAALFSEVKNMEIITPSEWLADLVKKSFLKAYPVKVVNNQVDLSVFKPINSDFREKNNLTDKKIILGVASTWSKQKGIEDFIKLAHLLSDDFKIVLVGLTKKQIKKIPKTIMAITRTNNLNELVSIYTAADVFLNLTYQDTYPTVNLEARACGTPVITYATGGSPESAGKDAIIVEKGSISAIVEALNEMLTDK